MDERIRLFVGRFPDVLSHVAPESVALVVADPPWNDPDAWTDVGAFAHRVLKPDGIVVGYIGNRWAFEALDRLGRQLNPVRLGFLPARHENLWDPDVQCLEVGSFLAIMSKGSFRPAEPWRNSVDGEITGRRWHRFQRPLVNVRHYVSAFSSKGDLVVDPYLGSGTTAVACAQLERDFIGCDVDPANVANALERLEGLSS